jgi:2-C-methyl-D-erythritol 4-phosphate cytidylyltransferase/2-C-methyl-D-erythritol 2,4-cyclodiphosphate synthase
MTIAVVLVAAGRGERLGAEVPKAFVELAGQTLIEHSVRRIFATDGVTQLIIAAPSTHLAEAQRIVESISSASDFGVEGSKLASVRVIAGGDTRQQSIENALLEIEPATEIILVHDAARALTPATVFERVARSVRETGLATIPVMPIVDTIKRVAGETVLDTVDRQTLRAAQTPQGFQAFELLEAYRGATEDFTDDAALVQSLGATVRYVDGDEWAFKVTTADDLRMAELRIAAEGVASFKSSDWFAVATTGSILGEYRTGVGVDVHRFTDDPAKPLFLGGVVWPGERGLDGHSDGDAVAHAIVDALLAAAGMGDIGSNFGVDRPEFAGASGQVFLTATVSKLAEAGYKVVNVSVQIVGNRPKVGPNRAATEAELSRLVAAPVTVGATTTDGLGFLGNTEGVAAVANALLIRSQVG